MEDALYDAQNGLCDVCMQAALGENDLILSQAPKSEAERSAEEADAEKQKLKFDPSAFEGKKFRDYKFPEFIEEMYLGADDGQDQDVIVIVKKPLKPEDQSAMTLMFIIVSVMFSALGIGMIWLVSSQILDGRYSSTTDLVVFIGIALLIAGFCFLMIRFGYHMVICRPWITLHDQYIQCYLGKTYRMDKGFRMKRQYLSLTYEYHPKNSDYHIELTSSENRKFEFYVTSEAEAEYWKDFIQWFANQKRES